MGSNTTQAVAILIMLIGFVLLAGAFAGGGCILGVGALALLVVAAFFFMKVKGLEHQGVGWAGMGPNKEMTE